MSGAHPLIRESTAVRLSGPEIFGDLEACDPHAVTSRTLTYLVLASMFAVGCSNKKPVARPTSPPAKSAKKKAPPSDTPGTPNVSVSDDDLVAQCKLKFDNRAKAPKFDLDRAELLPEDRVVLDQIAKCVTNGPLSGRAIELTGRADPRGTNEYNMGLGSQRAESIGAYLQRLGVPPSKLTKTTRGDLDATGTNEEGWRIDRRVDIKLAGREPDQG
jgi:peptidoglycan-associated lipoprotein